MMGIASGVTATTSSPAIPGHNPRASVAGCGSLQPTSGKLQEPDEGVSKPPLQWRTFPKVKTIVLHELPAGSTESGAGSALPSCPQFVSAPAMSPPKFLRDALAKPGGWMDVVDLFPSSDSSR